MSEPSLVFLSYRRSDSSGHARALYRDLCDRFRPGTLFFDRSSIESGDEFPNHLRSAIRESRVVLVLIGREWLEARDTKKRRRLDDPRDFVRQEVSLALKLKKKLVPVLFDDAPMPDAGSLPRPLVALASIDGLTLRGKTCEYDGQLQKLTRLIAETVSGIGQSRILQRYGAWTQLSPEYAFFRAIHDDPGDPQRVYAGLDEGQGLYRSNDGGRSWGSIDERLADKNVNAIAVSRLDRSLCVGTDTGLWVSSDRGRSWMQDRDFVDKSILSVAISPLDPGLRLVGCQRPGGITIAVTSAIGVLRPSKGTGGAGLKITEDGGITWMTFPAPRNVNGCWLDPEDSRVLAVVSAEDGLFLSRHGVEALRYVDTFPASRHPGCVAILPGDPRRILVGTMNSGIFFSDDWGATWTSASGVPEIQVSDVRVLKGPGGIVGAATPRGYYESTDRGGRWQPSVEGLVYSYCMSVTGLADGSAVIGTSGGGAYRRLPGSAIWNPSSSGLPSAPALCIGVTDRWLFLGTEIGVFGSTDSGESWRFLGAQAQGIFSLCVAPAATPGRSQSSSGLYVSRGAARPKQVATDDTTPNVYVGTASGKLLRSGDGGNTWVELALPVSGAVRAVILVQGSKRLGVAVEHQGVFLSNDDGQTWSAASTAALGPAVNLVISRHAGQKIFAMTSDRGVFVSETAGDSWARSDGIPEGEIILALAEGGSLEVVFAASLQGHLYRSTDAGSRFRRIATIPFPTVKREESLTWISLAVRRTGTSHTIVVGGTGAYVSRNEGRSWRALPVGPYKNNYLVNDLAIALDGGRLLMATSRGLLSRTLSAPRRVARSFPR